MMGHDVGPLIVPAAAFAVGFAQGILFAAWIVVKWARGDFSKD